MLIFSTFVLSGQSAATILGRLYYDKGGNSQWIATLVILAGFPILIPFLFLSPTQNKANSEITYTKRHTFLVVLPFYLSIGIVLAADSLLYSLGLKYLPASTFTLICASQLGFNAFFSYFLNSLKLTPFILNSIVLLTISSILLVFTPDTSNSTTPKGKYAIGFICTVSASAGYALMLSVTQLAFRKLLKGESFGVVVKLIVYQSAVATCFVVLGLFVSGEWRRLSTAMKEYELGSVSYVMTLVWTAVCWQVFNIGAVGLIFEVSNSLFSNVISTLGLPIVPVLSVFIFGDKMNGVKVVSTVLAVWGFVSYIYQHYLDDLEAKTTQSDQDVQQVVLIEKC